MSARRFLLLLLLVVISRLPFIFEGYGSDADAWRVAATAYHLRDTGEYRASRLPGYPLFEFLAAPFVLIGGAPLANATSIVAVVLVLLTWRRLTHGTARHPALLLVALAFTPIVWKNSTTTMDYLWSLLFILLALNRLLSATGGEHGRRAAFCLAGICLGIAVGFRPLNAVMVLPLLTLLIARRTGPGLIAGFLVCAGATALLSCMPPLLAYGPADWVSLTREATRDVALPPAERLLLFGYRGVYLLGPLAVIVAIHMLWRSRRMYAELVRCGDPLLLTLITGIAAPLLLFAAFPLEREYLIPLIPFLYLLLDRFASRAQMVAFLLAVVSLAVVTPDVVRHSGFRGSPGFNIHDGVLRQHVKTQRRTLQIREHLGTLPVEGPAVVMAGNGPELWLENDHFLPDTGEFWTRFPDGVVHRRTDPDVHVLYGLRAEELPPVRDAGYRVLCYAPAAAYLERMLRYRMEDQGVPVVGGSP